MSEGVKLILQLYYRPAAAMSAILDRGGLLYASLSVVVVSFALGRGASHWGGLPFFAPLLVLAVAFVPGLLLLAGAMGRLGGFDVSFQRDYSALLTCVALAWSADNVPIAIAGWVGAPPTVLLAVAGVAYLHFLILVFFAIRTALGAGNGSAIVVVSLSWIPLVAAALAWEPLHMVIGWLASPFFLFYAWYFLGGEFSNLGSGMRSRQNFRRMLEASTLNPHDGEAQYQLGLIYQERRNTAEALQRFQKAVQIDPTETDAQFQIGRIARQQGRIDDALKQFQIVLGQNPKHNMSEILRELGGTYIDAGRYKEAFEQLSVYIDRRPYDSEGLYYYGRSLEGLGHPTEAREVYERAVEADRTAPRYRRRFTARWSRLAQKQMRKVRPTTPK